VCHWKLCISVTQPPPQTKMMNTTSNHLRVKRHGLELSFLGVSRQNLGIFNPLSFAQKSVGWLASQGLPMLTKVLLFFSFIRNSSGQELHVSSLTPPPYAISIQSTFNMHPYLFWSFVWLFLGLLILYFVFSVHVAVGNFVFWLFGLTDFGGICPRNRLPNPRTSVILMFFFSMLPGVKAETVCPAPTLLDLYLHDPPISIWYGLCVIFFSWLMFLIMTGIVCALVGFALNYLIYHMPLRFRVFLLKLWREIQADRSERIMDDIFRRINFVVDDAISTSVKSSDACRERMSELAYIYRIKSLEGWFDGKFDEHFHEDLESRVLNELELFFWEDDDMSAQERDFYRAYAKSLANSSTYRSPPVPYMRPLEWKEYSPTIYHRCLRYLLVLQGIEPNPGPVLSKMEKCSKSLSLTVGQMKKTIRDLEELQTLLNNEVSSSVKEAPVVTEVAKEVAACVQHAFDEETLSKFMRALLEDAEKIISSAEKAGTPEAVEELKEAVAAVRSPQMMSYLTPSVNVGIDTSTKEYISSALRSVQELTASIPQFPSTVKLEHEVSLPQLDNVLSMLGLPKTDSPFAKIIAIIVVLGINYASYHSNMTPWAKVIVAVLTTGAGLWFVADRKFFEILMDLKSLVPYKEVPNQTDAQSFDLLGREGIVTVLCGALYYSVFNVSAPAGLAMEFIKRTSDLGRLKTGLETGFDMIMNISYKFLSFIGDLTDTDSLKHLDIKDAKLLDLTKRLYALIAEMNRTNEHGFDNHEALIQLDGEIRTYMVSLGDLKANMHEITACRDHLRTINQLLPLFVCGDKLGARQEPLGICLHGRTEQGKSVLLPNFIASIMARISTDKQWDRFNRDPVGSSYYLQGEKDFNEGLDASKLVVVVDELGQLRDSAANPSPEVFTVFRAINSNPWLADMAALHLKGKVSGRFIVVVATTNEEVWHVPSIIEPKAYGRRWPCEYWVTIQKRYATEESLKLDDGSQGSFKNRVPDWSKVLPDECGYPALDFCDFIPYDGLTGLRKTGAFLNYDEVMDDIAQKYRSKKNFSDKNLESHVVFRAKLDAQRKNGSFLPVCKPQAGEDGTGLPEFTPPDDTKYDVAETEEFSRVLSIPYHKLLECCPIEARRQLPYWDQCLMVREIYFNRAVRPFTTRLAEGLRGVIDAITKSPVVSSVLLGLTSAMLIWHFVKPSIITEDQAYHAKHIVAKHANKSVQRQPAAKWTIHPPFVDAQASCISQNTHDICRVVDRKSKFIVTLRTQLYDDTLTHEDEQSVQVGPTFGGAIFYGGRVASMPSHYRDRVLSPQGALPSFAESYPNLVMRFTRDSGTPKPWFFEVLWRELNEDNGRKNFLWTGCNEDLMFCRLPVACPRMKNILDFIPSEKEPFWDGNFNGALMRKNPSGGYDLEGSIMEVTKNVAYADYIGIRMITYPISTLHGECGSPVFVTDTRVKKPWLCGFHAAGDSVLKGHALPLVREDCEFALRYFEEGVTEGLEVHGGSDEYVPPPTLPQAGFVHYTSCLGPALPISQAHRTGITTAPLHGIMGEVQTAPARLTPGLLDGVFVSPLEKSISKNCNPRLAFNSKLLRQATLQTAKKIYSVRAMDDPGPAPVVWDQFHAIEGDLEFNPITRSTSAGYPWNLRYDRKKKRDFLGHDDYDYSSPACQELFRVLADKREKLKQGIDPGFVFVTNLKDETRPKAKVESFSTRSTEAEPIDLTILTREFFGDWMKYMHQTKISHGVLVGINPYSQDWSILAEKLLSYGDRMIAGDHSAWDGNFPTVLWFELLEIIEQYYFNSTVEDKIARRTIIEILANTKHLVVTRDDWWKLVSEDDFRAAAEEDQKILVEEFLSEINLPAVLKTNYFDEIASRDDYVSAYLRCLKPGRLKAFIIEWFGSLTSGGTLTSQAGSVGNQIVSRYAGYDHYLKPKGGHLSYERWGDVPFDEIEQDNGFFTFGDDNVISVGPKKFFNFSDLKASFSHYKMNYTNTKKTTSTHEYERLSEIDLLQRGFVYDKARGIWLSPLNVISIDEMVNWIRQSARPGDYERNLRSAIKEYSQHPYGLFHEKVELRLKPAAAAKLNLRFPELTFDNARDELTHTDAFYQ
jgi:hypothetical protein